MTIALITGASAGLGQEFFHGVCEQFPDLDKVWLIARRKERLEQLCENAPLPTEILALDLTEDDSFRLLEQKLAQEKPVVKMLINNAGMGYLDAVENSSWDKQIAMVDLNCRGLTAVTTLTLPYMEKGSFVLNVSSIASFAPNPNMTVYSSTKAFVTSFSRGLREELKARGIGVTAVCPGPMDTEFLTIAGIRGRSKMFDTLPYCNPALVARDALRGAVKGKAIVTPLFTFKLYRLVAKILPHGLVMKFAKT